MPEPGPPAGNLASRRQAGIPLRQGVRGPTLGGVAARPALVRTAAGPLRIPDDTERTGHGIAPPDLAQAHRAPGPSAHPLSLEILHRLGDRWALPAGLSLGLYCQDDEQGFRLSLSGSGHRPRTVWFCGHFEFAWFMASRRDTPVIRAYAHHGASDLVSPRLLGAGAPAVRSLLFPDHALTEAVDVIARQLRLGVLGPQRRGGPRSLRQVMSAPRPAAG